jgi:hypothetical protein
MTYSYYLKHFDTMNSPLNDTQRKYFMPVSNANNFATLYLYRELMELTVGVRFPLFRRNKQLRN